MSSGLRVVIFGICCLFVGLIGSPAKAETSKYREKIEMIDFRPYVNGELYDFVHNALAVDLEPYEAPAKEGEKPKRQTLYIATVDLNRDGVDEILASMDRQTFEVDKGAENPSVYVFSVDPGATGLREIAAFPAASVLLGSLYTGQYRNLLVNPDIRTPTRFISYRMNIDTKRYIVWEE